MISNFKETHKNWINDFRESNKEKDNCEPREINLTILDYFLMLIKTPLKSLECFSYPLLVMARKMKRNQLLW